MPDANPVIVITAEIIARLQAGHFQPFVIRLSDGRVIEVPTRDHCSVTPLLRRIEVETGEPRVFLINPLHVTSIDDKAA